MFFYVPGMSILAIYVLAAVLPAVFLMRYVYRKDTVEKEPPALLASLALMGVFAALAAMVLERIGESILNRLVSTDSRWYVILLAFLVVGAAEEGCKLFFLKRRSWWDPNFNYRFDGVVYAVFVSLGFAALRMSSTFSATASPWCCPGRCWPSRATWASPSSWAASTAGPSSARATETRRARPETSFWAGSAPPCSTASTTAAP